jgi:SAM-dependent methyltransferase
MRHQELWRPTKFITVDGRLQGDPTGAHVFVGSRIAADLVAPQYAVALQRYARGRLLDLGCGTVPLFEVYRTLADEVVCVDWPSSLHRTQHIDVFADLTRPLPLRDSSFDTVLLSDVLEHIPNPEDLIGEIARILRPDGHIVLGVPFLYWLHEIPHDFNRYTRYQLTRMLESEELEVVGLTEIGGTPAILADILSKTLAPRPRVAASFVRLAQWFLKRGFVQTISKRTISAFPLAYVVVARRPAA